MPIHLGRPVFNMEKTQSRAVPDLELDEISQSESSTLSDLWPWIEVMDWVLNPIMQAFYTSIIIVFLKGLLFQDSIAVLNPWIEAAQSKTWPLSKSVFQFCLYSTGAVEKFHNLKPAKKNIDFWSQTKDIWKTQKVDPHCHGNRLEPNYKPGWVVGQSDYLPAKFWTKYNQKN